MYRQTFSPSGRNIALVFPTLQIHYVHKKEAKYFSYTFFKIIVHSFYHIWHAAKPVNDEQCELKLSTSSDMCTTHLTEISAKTQVLK